jgi:5-methylcytosine-specific restriction endonuclease McrA
MKRGTFDPDNLDQEMSRMTFAIYVNKRANFTCEQCGSKHNPQAHHIKPVSKGGKSCLRNGICLCEKCHKYQHRAIIPKRPFTFQTSKEQIAYLRDKSHEETQAGKYTSAANIIQRLIAADMKAEKEKSKTLK